LVGATAGSRGNDELDGLARLPGKRGGVREQEQKANKNRDRVAYAYNRLHENSFFDADEFFQKEWFAINSPKIVSRSERAADVVQHA
jgi:hypothetical protein